jgi:hypothetical protein
MFKAAAGLAYRGATSTIKTSKLGFGEGSPGSKFTLDDVLTELAVERFHYAFHYDSTKGSWPRLHWLSKDKRANTERIVLRFSKLVYKTLTVHGIGYIVAPSRRIGMLFSYFPVKYEGYTSLNLQDQEVVYA